MLSFFKNSKLKKFLLFFLLVLFAACSSLQEIKHDDINKKIKIYQHLSENLELKGVVNYKNKTTKIFLYSKLRNHSIIKQTPLELPDGTSIEGKTSYEYNNGSALAGNWINSSSFNLTKAMLEKMLNEDEYVYNKEEIKVKVGLETLKINKKRIRDFLSTLDKTEKKYIQNTEK